MNCSQHSRKNEAAYVDLIFDHARTYSSQVDKHSLTQAYEHVLRQCGITPLSDTQIYQATFERFNQQSLSQLDMHTERNHPSQSLMQPIQQSTLTPRNDLAPFFTHTQSFESFDLSSLQATAMKPSDLCDEVPTKLPQQRSPDDFMLLLKCFRQL